MYGTRVKYCFFPFYINLSPLNFPPPCSLNNCVSKLFGFCLYINILPHLLSITLFSLVSKEDKHQPFVFYNIIFQSKYCFPSFSIYFTGKTFFNDFNGFSAYKQVELSQIPKLFQEKIRAIKNFILTVGNVEHGLIKTSV